MENGKDSNIDLGLALGNANHHNRGVGANANANANANARPNLDAIVGPRPLTELVWSKQNGLSIKCAAGINPCILKDVAPTQNQLPSQDAEKFVIAPPNWNCHVGSLKSNPGYLTEKNEDENVDDVKCVHFIEMENHNKGKGKECIRSCTSIPVINMAGTSEGLNNQTADLLPLLVKEPETLETKTENIGDGADIDIGIPLKMQDLVQEEEEEGRCFLEKVEETAENDVIVKDSAAAAIVERDGKGGEEDSSREDEGGSMESCNSASTKNKRCWRFEQQFIIGNKRIKKQSQECAVGVVKQQDSSFMNWISNMVKGVKPYQEEGPPHSIHDNNKKTLNVVSNRFGFRSVFQSLYSQDAKRLETKTQMESSKSKEIILFDKTTHDNDSLNQQAFGNLWITRLSQKTPTSTLLTTSNNNSSTTPIATHSKIDCFVCGKTGHEVRDCLQINENRNVLSRKKVSHSNEISKQIAGNNSLSNEDKILRLPKEMFDTIRRLRLSRTDILKWMNSHLAITNLDGYFLRLRLAKWEEGVGGAGYYVACITGENPSKGSQKPIRVNIGGVQFLVECRYISNCDFLEDELIAWWRTSGGDLMEEDLTSKLEERKKLGF